MNYKKHYEMLIERSRLRTLTGYCEKHHIIPKCLGGSDEPCNIAILTPEEHFLAHQLLVKMYPHSPPLINAAIIMSTHHTTMRANNKLFGWLRRRASEARKQWTAENGHPKGMLGKRHKDETKKKISTTCKKILSESIGVKVYAYHLDGTFYKEFTTLTECAADLKTSTSNVKYTAAGKFKYCKEKLLRYEYSEKILPYTKPEHPLKGKAKSAKHKESLSLSKKQSRARCIHCGVESSNSAITRYHNNNCKFKGSQG